jgi:hypothetical protein
MCLSFLLLYRCNSNKLVWRRKSTVNIMDSALNFNLCMKSINHHFHLPNANRKFPLYYRHKWLHSHHVFYLLCQLFVIPLGQMSHRIHKKSNIYIFMTCIKISLHIKSFTIICHHTEASMVIVFQRGILLLAGSRIF